MLPAAFLLLTGTSLGVTNIDPGALVRHPVVILRGTAPDTPDVEVGLDTKHLTHFPVVGNRFVGVVELKPGKNMVLLRAGQESVRLRVDYRPMTTPYRVATVYLAPQDETTDYEGPEGVPHQLYGEKLDTAMKLLQAFTAEAMNDAGYGRKTFPLEFDADGRVKVHVVRSEKTGKELRAMDGNALWYLFHGSLGERFSYATVKCCAIMSFTRYDRDRRTPLAHTALGGGGLGLFGGASLWTWPTSLAEVPTVFANDERIDPAVAFDDSGRRGTVWAQASTTLGAVLHEMGHTFGLPHSPDPNGVMSRGFDHLNRAFTLVEPPRQGRDEPTYFKPDEITRWDPFHAARLAWNPWFQPDGNAGAPFSHEEPPTLAYDPAKGEVTVTAPHGLRVFGFERADGANAFRTFPDAPVRTLKISPTELSPNGSGKMTAYALDDWGNEAKLDLP